MYRVMSAHARGGRGAREQITRPHRAALQLASAEVQSLQRTEDITQRERHRKITEHTAREMHAYQFQKTEVKPLILLYVQRYNELKMSK